MEKICEYCGDVFNTSFKNQRFCSRKCSSASTSKKVECLCDNCGKPFFRKMDEFIKHKNNFCSQSCHYNYSYETVVCKNCGKEFSARKSTHRKYCCNDCKNYYVSHHQKTNKETIICKYCGKEFQAHVSAKRDFCSKECGYAYRRENKQEYDYYNKQKNEFKQSFLDKYNALNSTIIIDDEYVDMYNKLSCHCSIHNQYFKMRPLDILRNRNACTKCQKLESRGEKRIRECMEENNIEFIREYKFDNCKDKLPLPFDFYLPNNNMCIEYQGEQHYIATDFFGGKEEFNKRVLHDNIKYNYCLSNNIDLLIIPYTEYENIPNIISQLKTCA